MIKVRALELKDIDDIRSIDDSQPFFEISDFIQDILEEAESKDYIQDYAYGIFKDNKLIGYCTIGGADEIECAEYNDELLSDVYILDKYQGNGYGTELVKYALNNHPTSNIYADILDENLIIFYSILGFKKVKDEDYLLKITRT